MHYGENKEFPLGENFLALMLCAGEDATLCIQGGRAEVVGLPAVFESTVNMLLQQLFRYLGVQCHYYCSTSALNSFAF